MSEQNVILIVEDDPDHVFLMKKALTKGDIGCPILSVKNGEEAIAYLKGEGPFANRAEFPLPSLVLLDLKMPCVDGFQVLQWIRSVPGLSSLPVLVLTNSDELRDVNRAYSLGANSFLIKPFDFENYFQLANTLKEYWLGLNQFPSTYRSASKPSDSEKSGRRPD